MVCKCVVGTGKAYSAYGSKQGIHEPIRLVWSHETLTLNDAHGKPGNHGEMLLKGLADDLAVTVIVFHRSDLPYSSQGFEGLVVKFVDVGHVRVGHDDIRQGLHVPKPVSEPSERQSRRLLGRREAISLYRVGSSVRT